MAKSNLPLKSAPVVYLYLQNKLLFDKSYFDPIKMFQLSADLGEL
jgi:hypothetical protein